MPTPDAFNARIYCYVTPDYVLGVSQEVSGAYGTIYSQTLFDALVVRGDTRKTIYLEAASTALNLFQHKNVLVGNNSVGEAYIGTQYLGAPIERQGWVFLNDANAFIAIRPARGGYVWREDPAPSVFGKYLKFGDPPSPFLLEVARPSEYGGNFEAFASDILDNELHITPGDGRRYQSCSNGTSGPPSERFTVELRPSSWPTVNGQEVELASYPTIGSPHVNSAWDSGIVTITYGGEKLTLDFGKAERISSRLENPGFEEGFTYLGTGYVRA